MVHAGLMSERALLVVASQHQQPAEVSVGNQKPLPSGSGVAESVGGTWAVTAAPKEELEKDWGHLLKA